MVSIGYLIANVGLFEADDIARRERIANDLVAADVSLIESETGPRVIESMVEEEWAVRGLLESVESAEDEMDAFVVGCFGDPGLAALREFTDTPVVGPAETSYHTAAMLGDTFTCLNLTDESEPLIHRAVHDYHLDSRLTSIRTLDLGVADIEHDSETIVTDMAAAGRAAIDEDGADVLIPGCMGLAFMQVHEEIAAELGVPFLDPVTLSLETARTWAEHGLAQSPTASPTIDRSRLTGLVGEPRTTPSTD